MVEKESVYKCCVHGWRIAFLVLNILFFLIGLALVGLAIYLLASQNDLQVLTGSRIASGGVLILIAGFITAIISFIGILGAIGMWPVLLIIYIVLLFIIVILEIVAGIVGFVFRTELVDLAESRALDAIDQYRPEGNPELQDDVNQIVDFLQNEFDCCGYTSSDDWLNTTFFNLTQNYPDSCNCTEEDDMNPENNVCVVAANGQQIYVQSCNSSVSDFLDENLIIVGAVGIAFGLFEVIGIGVAIALTCCFCAIRNNKEDYEFTKAI